MNFRALEKKGKLHGEANGLALGAGTERLIYAVAPLVNKTTITDLYLPNSGWIGVRTENPLDLVLGRSPWPIAPGKLDAMAMDMRALDFPDESFDFCWSTGSFEHIGKDEDFLRHFSEVERVLKPGGVYTFTTAVTFGGVTEPVPHNYYFDPDHLVDLIHASPLHAEPEFDCEIRNHLYNRPHPERFEDYGFADATFISKPIVSFRRGIILTANVMVLTKDRDRAKVRPTVRNLAKTRSMLKHHADVFINRLWSSPQIINLEKKELTLSCQPQSFGDSDMLFDAIVPQTGPKSLSYTIASRPASLVYSWENETKGTITGTDSTFRFKTKADRIYKIKLSAKTDEGLGRIILKAKREK